MSEINEELDIILRNLIKDMEIEEGLIPSIVLFVNYRDEAFNKLCKDNVTIIDMSLFDDDYLYHTTIDNINIYIVISNKVTDCFIFNASKEDTKPTIKEYLSLYERVKNVD